MNYLQKVILEKMIKNFDLLKLDNSSNVDKQNNINYLERIKNDLPPPSRIVKIKKLRRYGFLEELMVAVKVHFTTATIANQ